MSRQIDQAELDELIADEFGVNADYVGELFRQFERNPRLVDEEWREYFHGLLGNGGSAAAGDGKESSPDVAPAAPASSAPRAAQSLHATYDWGRTDPAASPAAQKPAPAPDAPATAAEASAPAPKPPEAAPADKAEELIPLRGPALRIAENMEASISVPTATSQRQIPIKLLDENRRLINQFLKLRGRKVSYTHLIARAIVKALDSFPRMNDSYEEKDGAGYRVKHSQVNLGVAVDVTKKDGTRSLLVPNVKGADKMSFSELLDAYDDIIRRARAGKLTLADFEGTTISLTNPGTIGTTASNPRLMKGQGTIVATGAIEYPPEYQGMSPEGLSRIGISKIMTITSTYDHRIIQGAESGAFLAAIDEMLRGQHEFYEEIFRDLSIPYRPYRWATDINPAIFGEDRSRDEVRKQARVFELINAYRVRGHLIADIDPLGWEEVQYHPELDIETYGLTIWDLDRQFVSGGIGGKETATLREIVELLQRYYGSKVGIEYRHIQGPEEKEWIRARVEADPPAIPER